MKVSLHMRLCLLLFTLLITLPLFSQVRLTNNPDSSYTSDNNAQCIAAIRELIHVVWTDTRFGNAEVFYKRSQDHGHTWEDDAQLSLSNVSASYPSIAVSGNTVHVVWTDHRHTHSEIYYKRSLDNGTTWSPDILLTDQIGEQVRPTIAADGPNVHVVWEANDHKASEIWYLKSTDNGSTWETSMRLSNALSNSLNPSITVFENSVHVVWGKTDGSGVYYRHSLDNGNSWLPQYELTTVSSFSEEPMIICSDTVVFAFWSDRRNGAGDIYMRRSIDNGATWQNDVKLPGHNNQAKTPRAATEGPYVYVVWNEINISDWATFEVISTDAGVSWSQAGVSPVSQGISTGAFVALEERDVHIISTEESDGNKEIYYYRTGNGNPFLDHNTFAWGHAFGSAQNDVAYDVVADSARNVYVTGSFENTVDFDPAAADFDLVSAGGTDIFIAKYDSTGQLLWAKRAGGNEDDVAYSLALDKEGNVYATGSFRQTAEFDPEDASHDMTSFGEGDIFVLKLNAQGLFVWAGQMGGDGQDEGRSIAIDLSGNILTTGLYSNTGDFNPSNEVSNLVSNGLTDIFISKLDHDGNFLWAQSTGGPGADAAHSVTTDLQQSIVLTGSYSDSVDFDPGANVHMLTSNGLTDIFILKLDQDGQWQWADSFGAEDEDEGNAIVCDHAGNVFSTGSFSSNVDFNPDVSTAFLQSQGLTNVYISKLNTDGHYVWAKYFAGNGDEGKDITLDDLGNIYTTGSFNSETDFDPGPAQLSLYANNQEDVFISKLSPTGAFVSINQLSGSALARGNAITTLSSAYIWCAGEYSGNIDLDPTIGVNLEQDHGSNKDFFLLQLKQCQPQNIELNVNSCTAYLSPDGHTLWTTSGTYETIIPTALGCDSVITVHLIIAQPTMDDVVVSACDEFTTPDGSAHMASGIYQVVLTNVGGCDSIINYHLTILQSSQTNIDATACNEYTTADGMNTWFISGTYPITFTNTDGCDSILNYHITINHDSQSEIIATSCNSYSTPDGQHTWTASGIYPLLFSNVHGCDSIINYNVTIDYSSETQVDLTTCDTYSTPDGQHTWTETGVYPVLFTSIHGCDSIINYNVTILQSSQTEIEATACNVYSSPDGLFSWTTSGSYPVIYANIAGCDSIVTYNLTIHYDRDTVMSVMACDSYTTPDGLHNWQNSGVYVYTIPTQMGCDSTITLDLNIVSLDNSVTVIGTSLMSDQVGASYQWINCDLGNQIIEGETEQTFSPTASGNYGVIINMNECSDTSSCVPVTITGIHD
ncbi:MAG: SBBP repeat-containing protein, partial [Saprospiraceae bacterium]